MEQPLSLIIEEFADRNGSLEIIYQKRADGLCPSIYFANPAFFFARCASTFEVRSPADRHGRIFDAYSVAVMPAKQTIQLFGNTAISDGVYMSPKSELIEAVNQTYQIDFLSKMQTIQSLAVLPRTNWLNEIMHRYVYERVASKNANNAATTFLEQELVKEIYYRIEEYSVRDKSRFDLDDKATDMRNPVLRAAMAFIEANLFRDITVQDIALKIDASDSTLLREFQKRIGKSPTAYIIDRRLEEAMILLKGQRYAVSQISDIIGYENVSAFSAAFKKRFGVSPSQVVVKDPMAITTI